MSSPSIVSVSGFACTPTPTSAGCTPSTPENVREAEDVEFSLELGKKKKNRNKKAAASASPVPDASEGGAAAPVPADSGSADAEEKHADHHHQDQQAQRRQEKEEEEGEYPYADLLSRLFEQMRAENRGSAAAGAAKRAALPLPQTQRLGTKKTAWVNFRAICQTLQRAEEHALAFFVAELGAEGALDGQHRLVLRGRFQDKQLLSLLKTYIAEYVTCGTCRRPDTALARDAVTRLHFMQCESCGSRRAVAPIKSGFHATNRTDRKKLKAAV